jgi:hypothetical protein
MNAREFALRAGHTAKAAEYARLGKNFVSTVSKS